MDSNLFFLIQISSRLWTFMNFSLQSEFRPRFKSTEPDLLLDERSIFLYHFAKGLSFFSFLHLRPIGQTFQCFTVLNVWKINLALCWMEKNFAGEKNSLNTTHNLSCNKKQIDW